MTLLALLELVRLGQVRARQAEPFGDITIEQHAVSVGEPLVTSAADGLYVMEAEPDHD